MTILKQRTKTATQPQIVGVPELERRLRAGTKNPIGPTRLSLRSLPLGAAIALYVARHPGCTSRDIGYHFRIGTQVPDKPLKGHAALMRYRVSMRASNIMRILGKLNVLERDLDDRFVPGVGHSRAAKLAGGSTVRRHTARWRLHHELLKRPA